MDMQNWVVLNGNRKPIGVVFADSAEQALRRFYSGFPMPGADAVPFDINNPGHQDAYEGSSRYWGRLD